MTTRQDDAPGLAEWFDKLEREWWTLQERLAQLEPIFAQRERNAYNAARARGEIESI